MRPSISALLCIGAESVRGLGGGTAKVQAMPRAVQLEHGWTRLHLNFFTRHDWHDTGSGRALVLCIIQWEAISWTRKCVESAGPVQVRGEKVRGLRGIPGVPNSSCQQLLGMWTIR